MHNRKITDWLPTTRKEAEMRGWDELDVIMFSGDAYVDHPSFGAAVICRLLEAEGLRVAIVPQPNWQDDLRDFKKMGRPRLFFGISAGCMDSMVNKYTAAKRFRSEDAYSPNGNHSIFKYSEEAIPRLSCCNWRYRGINAPFHPLRLLAGQSQEKHSC